MDILIKLGKAMGVTPLKEKSYSELMKMTKGMDEAEVESSGLGKLLRAAKRREDAPKKEAAAKRKITQAEGKAKKAKGGYMKPQMANGGMANGKPHLYLSEGALVVDKLPNAGTKALAKTAKGRKALRNMKLI